MLFRSSAFLGLGMAPVWETGRGNVTVLRGAGFGNGVAGTGYGLGVGEAGESKVAVGEFERPRQVAPAPAERLHTPPPTEFPPVENQGHQGPGGDKRRVARKVRARVGCRSG